jgi:signal transduction histidine kinase
MQAPEGGEAAAALDSALEEVARLDHLAVNLLVLARARSAGPPSQDPVDIGAVAHRAVDIVRRARRDSTVPIDVTGAAVVPGDASALERALVNVVDNAARHARARVGVTVRPDSDHVVVEVIDDGPGFPAELVDAAAARFVRGPTSSDHGAGLGLAIADAIAAVHGGSTEITNRPEGGASVRLILPSGA